MGVAPNGDLHKPSLKRRNLLSKNYKTCEEVQYSLSTAYILKWENSLLKK